MHNAFPTGSYVWRSVEVSRLVRRSDSNKKQQLLRPGGQARSANTSAHGTLYPGDVALRVRLSMDSRRPFDNLHGLLIFI